MKKRLPIVLLVAGLAYGAYAWITRPPSALMLTGIVTTNDVIVSPQIGGRIGQLRVKEGDTRHAGPAPRRDRARRAARPSSAYYTHSAEGVGSQVQEGEAALRFQEQQTDRADRAGRGHAGRHRGAAGGRRDGRRSRTRERQLERTRRAVASRASRSTQELDQARTALRRRAGPRRRAAPSRSTRSGAAVALAQRQRRAGRHAAQPARRPTQQQQAAAGAQRAKADVRLAYTEVHAPIDGIVDVRAARVGRGRHRRPAGRHR